MYKFEFAKEIPIKFTRKGEPIEPVMWVAETRSDADLLTKQGRTFIRFGGDKDVLTKLIIYPYLFNKFPGIKWAEILDLKGRKKNVSIIVPGNEDEEPHDISDDFAYNASSMEEETSDRASSQRMFTGGYTSVTSDINITDYFADFENVVDMEKLAQMNLVPRFLDKIIGAVSTKADDVHWQDGYNKKLGYCLGNFVDDTQADNLLIIDVSASIPRAVSATMLALADQMREQMKADIIITGATSIYWEYGEKLPTPQELRRMIPPSNESNMFNRILREKILNRTWDNIVAFGDNDCPSWMYAIQTYHESTRIGKLYSFRVPWDPKWIREKDDERPVGYSLWVKDADPNCEYEGDQTWIKDINLRYKE